MEKKKLLALSLLGAALLCSCGNGGEGKGGASSPEGATSETSLNGYYEVEDAEGNLYKGNFVDGVYSGYGVMEYASTTVYEGTWEDGKWEGSCKITWDSGCIYIGEAHEGAMDGIGYMIWPMGDYYYGEWKNGSPNGAGTKYYMVDSTAEDVQHQYNIYTGDMVNNLKVGKGVMRYSFGAIYDGEWANDIRSGQGTVYWEPGLEFLKFVGEFKNDWIDGEGTMYYTDGRIVKGTFKGTDQVGVDSKDQAALKAHVAKVDGKDLSSSTLCIGTSYFSMWANIATDLASLNPVNFGIGGTLASFWNENMSLLSSIKSAPKSVLIYVGGNDFSTGRNLTDTTADVKGMITQVMALFPNAEVVYVPLVPAPCKISNGVADSQHALNKAIEEYVSSINSAKLRYIESDNFVYLPKGETGTYFDAEKGLYLDESLYMSDNLHLNAEGNKLFGEAILAAI